VAGFRFTVTRRMTEPRSHPGAPRPGRRATDSKVEQSQAPSMVTLGALSSLLAQRRLAAVTGSLSRCHDVTDTVCRAAPCVTAGGDFPSRTPAPPNFAHYGHDHGGHRPRAAHRVTAGLRGLCRRLAGDETGIVTVTLTRTPHWQSDRIMPCQP
jgi:hypothetical protein